MSVVVFAVVTFFLNDGEMHFKFDLNTIFLLVYPFIVLSALMMSYIVPKMLLKNARKATDLTAKLNSYRTVSMVKFIVLEGSAMLGVVFYLLSKNGIFLTIAALLIIYLIAQRPTLHKVENDLELRGELRNKFQRYDEVIE
ncbi:hypothetical protein KAOT1_01455 [Kordia algicida OT-1]|uniref:Uncharacterized protein n=2 Tax=Kordia TaxID=221065 RepID=A9E929_9FLAO|nr:hypothetical protein KAOT1_01455 [Kordia algicida OT-1]